MDLVPELIVELNLCQVVANLLLLQKSEEGLLLMFRSTLKAKLADLRYFNVFRTHFRIRLSLPLQAHVNLVEMQQMTAEASLALRPVLAR